jgi:hypothetical protein
MNRRGAARTTLVVAALLVSVEGGFGPTTAAQEPARAGVLAGAFVPLSGQSCQTDAGVTFGSNGDGIACLQFTLALMGLYQGELTADFDQATSDAVVRFQQVNPPLRIDGHVGQTMLGQIGIYSGVDLTPAPRCLTDADLVSGDIGDGVRCLQTTLAEFAYLDGAVGVTGTFDGATFDAVARFQADTTGLISNGIANSGTLAALGIWSGVSTSATPSSSFEGQIPVSTGLWPAPFQDEAFWNLNPEGIPYYGNRGQCTRANADMIALQFALDGAPIDVQQWAVYIASREGGCDHTIVNLNYDTRDDSHCTFQLNALAGMFEPWAELGRRGWSVVNVKESMANCADAASDLWVFCGKAPWTPPYGCTPPWEGDLGEGDA